MQKEIVLVFPTKILFSISQRMFVSSERKLIMKSVDSNVPIARFDWLQKLEKSKYTGCLTFTQANRSLHGLGKW